MSPLDAKNYLVPDHRLFELANFARQRKSRIADAFRQAALVLCSAAQAAIEVGIPALNFKPPTSVTHASSRDM